MRFESIPNRIRKFEPVSVEIDTFDPGAMEILSRRLERASLAGLAHQPIGNVLTAPIAHVARPHADLMVAQPLSPGIAIATAVQQPTRRTEYSTRTLVHQDRPDASMPCAELGGHYREETATGEVEIGCQDVLRLGSIAYRQYDEVTALANARRRVYRSLAQPGRFLVLPAAYRVTRYGQSEGDRAYRPVILVYSVVDATAGSRYFLSASLQPDLTEAEQEELLEQLVSLTTAGHDPSLDFPTDPAVQATVSYRWAIPSQLSTPTVLEGVVRLPGHRISRHRGRVAADRAHRSRRAAGDGHVRPARWPGAALEPFGSIARWSDPSERGHS